MLREVLKSKIYRAVTTDVILDYEGSLTVDPEMMRAAKLVPFEKVMVANVSNGARFETYVIEGTPHSGEMILNGAAARLGQKGDLLIVFSFSFLDDEELRDHEVVVVLPKNENRTFTVRRESIEVS